MTAKELRDLKSGLVKIASDMRAIVKLAEDEDRGLNADEQTNWSNLSAAYEEQEGRVARGEEIIALPDFDQPGNDPEGRTLPGQNPPGDPHEPAASAGTPTGTQEYKDAFRSWAVYGPDMMTGEERKLLKVGRIPDDEIATVRKEMRALGVGSGSIGGFTVPEDFAGFVTEVRKQFGGFFAAASLPNGPNRIVTASGNDLPFPTVDDTAQEGEILAENTAANEQDVAFGNVILGAFKYSSKMIKVAMELLQDEAVGLETVLGRLLGIRLGRITNRHYTLGTGTAQPLGVINAVPTALRKSAAASGAITYNDMLDTKHLVDPAYRPGLWMFNDATFKAIKQILDGDLRPLWQPEIGLSAPATLDGDTFIIDQSMENIGTAGRSVAYGNYKTYIIREVAGLRMVRLSERFAEADQVAFLGWLRADSDQTDTTSVAVLVH